MSSKIGGVDEDVGCILALASDGREALLKIHQGPQPKYLSGLSLQFRTNGLAGFIDTLPAETEVQGPVECPWGSTYVYLTDPNGVSVVVFEGGI